MDIQDCVDDPLAGLWRCPYRADFVLQAGRGGSFQYQLVGTVNGDCNTTSSPFGPQPDPPHTVNVATGQTTVRHVGRVTLDTQPNPARVHGAPGTPSTGRVQVGPGGVRSDDDPFYYPAAECP